MFCKFFVFAPPVMQFLSPNHGPGSFWMLNPTMEMDFREKYLRKLAENCWTPPDGHCSEWRGAQTRGYGKINVKYEGRWTTVTTHRLLFILHNNLRLDDLAGLDVSHLCHNPPCASIDHLSAEEHSINNERQACRSRRRCFGHQTARDCLFF